MHRSALSKRRLNLIDQKTDVVDTSYRSVYFTVSELESVFTAGKNYFTINGSPLLKKNSPISLEILDSSGKTVYFETGKKGYISELDTTDLVVSVHVVSDTSDGFGSLTLIGVTVDNKSVKWSSTIKINPTIDNSSRVIFLKKPSLEVGEFLSFVLNETWTSDVQQIVTTSGSIYTVSNFPTVYSDVKSIDFKKSEVDYRLRHSLTSTDIRPFTKQNGDTPMTLHVQKISCLDNGVLKMVDVNLTESVSVMEVLSNGELKLAYPILYTINGKTQIVPVVEGDFVQTFNGTAYITSSGLITDGNPDGVPDPDVFLSKPVGSSTAFVKESFLDIVYKNLKTLTGKIHRHKVYRRSLNKASDFECISDEPLLETETLFDGSTANRTFAEIGQFFNQDHTDRYYHTSSAGMTLSQSSTEVLNSAVLLPGSENEDGSRYVIIKNDTSLITYSSSREIYVNYNEEQSLIKSGSSYDSNFIRLYKDSDYLMSADLELSKLIPSKESKLVFYLTGSFNTSSVDINYEEGMGIKLHEYVLPIGTNTKKFSGNHDARVLNFTVDCVGALKIVPINLYQARMSKLSLRSFAEFGFSPDVFSARIIFPVTIKNEQFEIKSEFFDVNSRSIYSGLRGVVNVDRYGETLFKNITNYLITDSETIRSVISSGSLTISASRLEGGLGFGSSGNRSALSVVESLVVMSGSAFDVDPFFVAERQSTSNKTYVKVSGSFKLTGSLFIKGDDARLYGTSSHAISSSFTELASGSISSSWSIYSSSSLSSSWAESASYAYKASSSLSSSGANSALSSSWSVSSSYADSSMSSSHILYGESASPGAPVAAGYLAATLNGSRIYVQYFTSV